MHNQISVFDLLGQPEPEDRFTYALKYGSGFDGGKIRIYAASMTTGDNFPGFLRKEYGIGGHSADFPDGGRGFVDYDGSGMIIREWKTNREEKKTWRQIADGIRELIRIGNYLTEKERLQVLEIERNHGGILPEPIGRLHYV